MNSVREFIFGKEEKQSLYGVTKEAEEALKYVCLTCKRGFKSKAAAASHKSLKHK